MSRDRRWPFFSLDVEISTRCDQDCLMCPRQRLTRPQGLMPKEIFSRIAAAAAPLGSRMTLSGLGNPLSHPEWPEFIDEYKRLGGQVGLVVHAAHLVPENREKLCAARPHFLEISFPSIDRESYHSLCPRSDFDEAMNNIVRLRQETEKSFPFTVVGLRTSLNRQEGDRFNSFWRDMGIPSRRFACHSRAGHLDRDLVPAEGTLERAGPCGLFAFHAFVTCQGRLLACCHDMAGKTELGDFSTDTINALCRRKVEIIASASPFFPLCRRCDDRWRHVPLPEGAFPETEKARRKFLRRLARADVSRPGR